MLRLAVLSLVVALIAFPFGFGLISSAFAGAAKILFFVLVVLAMLSFLVGTSRRTHA
jgi:uncharacterized membrane protein YtjA (UPF0391 family)